jgi:hypothetical protein
VWGFVLLYVHVTGGVHRAFMRDDDNEQ